MEQLIGRNEEKELLKELLKSKKAELLAVYGRHRVGKTYLIHTYLKDHIVFHLTGTFRAPLKEQLNQFSESLQVSIGSPSPLKRPDSWINAFRELRVFLEPKLKKQKLVLFLDEFPWLDGKRSGFLRAFDNFWNNWANFQPELLIIICGSSASWMITNIINNRGGLHNRITAKMPIVPFTLAETEAFLRNTGCKLDRYQILQIYMAFGGIPHYLNTVKKGRSASQVIEKACFSRLGLLKGEFDNLYNSLFELADNHIKVVRALADSSRGLSRNEIIKKCSLSSGGRATKILNELERSSFIQEVHQFGNRSKNAIYKLIDEYSLFYLKFMDNNIQGGKDHWGKISSEPTYISWCGLAFEAICLKHVEQIVQGLAITKRVEASTWRYIPSKSSKETGAQIDLVLDRKDHIINLCELKFYSEKFAIDKNYAKSLENKMHLFREKETPRKSLFLTFITTHGLIENQYAEQLVQQEIDMNVLFKPL